MEAARPVQRSRRLMRQLLRSRLCAVGRRQLLLGRGAAAVPKGKGGRRRQHTAAYGAANASHRRPAWTCSRRRLERRRRSALGPLLGRCTGTVCYWHTVRRWCRRGARGATGCGCGCCGGMCRGLPLESVNVLRQAGVEEAPPPQRPVQRARQLAGAAAADEGQHRQHAALWGGTRVGNQGRVWRWRHGVLPGALSVRQLRRRACEPCAGTGAACPNAGKSEEQARRLWATNRRSAPAVALLACGS